MSICEKLYSSECSTYQKAQAHQCLALALLATKKLEGEEYFEEAMSAWRCALNCVDGGHPRLTTFRQTLG